MGAKINFRNCTFSANILNARSFNLEKSATALVIKSLIGALSITDSVFENSFSDSTINFISAELQDLIINNSRFSNSSYQIESMENNMLIQGGFIQGNVQKLIIFNSIFEKSKCYSSAFLDISANSEEMIVSINNTIFADGIAI